MIKPKPHEVADAEIFAGFQEEWIVNNVSIVDVLSIPGVANLIMEEFNDKVIEAYDEEHEE